MINIQNIHLNIGQRVLLENEALNINEGHICVIMGESGSGKTTLLHEISLLSSTSSMQYFWDDVRVDLLNNEEKASIRRLHIGYILQNLELISENLTLKENLQCITALSGQVYNESKIQVYMKKLNLHSPLNQHIEAMSRGEKQRFALVLALAKDTDLMILDEPTSALDIDNSHELMNYLKIIASDYHKMIVIATHDDIVAQYARKQTSCHQEM